MSMFTGFWSGGSSTPKRSGTLKPSPLTPKLTAATAPEYPPPLAHDTQWEHVKSGPPSSPDIEDEAAFERLGDSQVAPSSGSPPQWQEEAERLHQQLEASRAAQYKAEGDRDKWERKVMELRAMGVERERKKEGSYPKGRRERELDRDVDSGAAASGMTDVLKEENEKLKSMLQQQTQQLDAAQEGMKQERSRFLSDAERLTRELNIARGAHREEAETLKVTLQEHAQRIEHLMVEGERARKDKESVKRHFNAEVERLKEANTKEGEQMKTALEELNRNRLQMESELRKARRSLDAYASKLDDSTRENDAIRRELSHLKESQRMAAELKHRLDIQNRELRSAREESSALKKEFHQLTTLLEDRTSELKGAQSFLTTADAFSGAEVTNTLQRLNAEVLQSTAFMAESMVELFFLKTVPRVSKAVERAAACERVSAAIGGVIVDSLGTKKHTDDPILIQIAFQAYLAYHLRWIACAWIIGGEEHHNQFIDAIYQSVHEKEAQAIAGRWRALTRAHVPSTSLDDSQIPFRFATKIISGLGDILLAAGCTAPKSDIASALSSKFAEKLALLVTLALRVNKIVGEDVTSGDFEVLAIPPGTTFDATTMEDSYDDGGSSKGRGNDAARVLCATDLGLRKKTRVGMTGEKQWEIKVLLKPKVALESVVDIMDE